MINRKKNLLYIIALTLAVTGCEMMGPKLHDKLPLASIKHINETSEQPEVIYQELSNEAADAADEDAAKIQLFPGTGEFVSHRNVRGQTRKGTGKGEFSLNFDDADLGEVTKVILSDILGENYVLSPKVSGKVTLQTSQPLTRSELLPTLDMLLDINNAAMVFQDGLYQIKSKAEALSGSAFSTYNNFKQKMPAGYQVRVIPVKNVSVEELSEIIKPLLQDKTILHVDSNRNMMLVAGTAVELARTMEMVNAFDVSVLKGRSFGLFPLENVDAAKIIEELEQVFNNSDGPGNSFFRFMQIERLNAILAITHQEKYLYDIERWVLRLDKANNAAGGGVIVYRVQHVDAVEMAGTLNDIFSQSGSQRSRSASVAAGRKTVQVTNKNKTKTKTAQTRRKLAAPSVSDVGEVKIIADEVNNALIIVATAQDYSVIHRVIKDLDVMPLQVLIDATIVDVNLTDDLKYGIQWFFSHENGGDHSATGGGDLLSTLAPLAAASFTGGFGYAFASNSGDVKAVISAQAKKGNVNIISSPSLMVLNNQEAYIQVAEERSLRTSETTNLSSDNNNVTNTIQQRKAGVTVTVKPRVNANGLVIMEIEQSVENFLPGDGENGNPDISTREIKSTIAVQSGETIVLGGLISETSTRNKAGVPFLHELPIIGPLFGSTRNENNKTELVVLITPRVVKSKQDARLVTNEFQRKLSGIYEEEMVEILEQ